MFLILLVFLITFFLLLFDDYMKKSRPCWKKISKFPGDTPLPLLGNIFRVGFDADDVSTGLHQPWSRADCPRDHGWCNPVETPGTRYIASDDVTKKLLAMWTRHGKQNFRLSNGSEHWILLSEPDDIKMLLNDTNELAKPLERNAAMTPFFGKSVSTSEGQRWQFIRKLITPCFHFKSLQRMPEDLSENINLLFDILDNYVGKGPVDMYTCFRPYMLDILSSSLFGIEHDFLKNPEHSYLKASGKMTSMYTEMMDTIKEIKRHSSDIITKRRCELNKMIEKLKNDNNNVDINYDTFIKNKLSESNLLDRLLLTKTPNGELLTDDIINEEISLILFSGHYTTSMTMSHTMYFLAKYPEIQKKVLEEQMLVFGKDFYNEATIQNLSQMKYLEAVIKESMRNIPIVARIGRQLKNDMTFQDGRVAPAGTTVIVFYDGVFRNPKIFEDPEKFKPERFLDPMHTFAFVPFSAGPRNCVAYRYAWVIMKVTLSIIIRRYKILPGGPGTEPRFANRVITESTNGIRLRLTKRNLSQT